MKKVCFLLLVLFCILPMYPIDTHWESEPIVIKNGLNNNTIYNVCYGSDGFIWLSTDMGITRYDGFRFRDYPLIMSVDSLSTPLNQPVKSICEAPDGLYYALLCQGGIACFDKENEKFLPFRFDRPLKMKDITGFCWNDETLYLATQQGLFEALVDRKEGNEGEYLFCIVKSTPIVKGKVDNICTDNKTNIYFSVNREKVMRYDLMSKQTSVLKETSGVGKLILDHGYLWICRLWNDIICHDLAENRERVILLGDVGNSDGINSYITDIVLKDPKTVYLTTWNGLYKLKFADENLCESPFELVQLTQNEKSFRLNIENKMTSMVWDEHQQILWIGTFGGGIVKIDISENMYSRVQQNFKQIVNGIVEDTKGFIWLSVADGGIMKSTVPGLSSTTKFEPWKKSSALPPGGYRIYKAKDGNIWMGNNQGEVVFVDPLTEDISIFHLQTERGERIQSYIHGFCLDSWNRLWVATSDGLVQVNAKTHACKKIKLPDGIKSVYAATEDKEGNVWVGTDRGLKRLDFDGERVNVTGNYERENGLEETAVRTIYVNNYNQIYAAYLNIVIRIDGREKDKVESIYTLQKGLASGHVSCMVDDHIGNTWAGNSVGIMTIRNGQDAFYNYLSIGNCGAVCRMADGRLLWTNSWGMFYFDPSVAKVDGSRKQLMLTDIEVNGATVLAGEKRNGQVILSVSPEKQNELTFSAVNNDFHLYFSDLRYGMMERKISYRLLPADKEWKIVPLSEGLWFNGLSTGKYTLQAKLVFPDGKEGEVVQIPVVVKAKWYHSVWAYVAYGLVLVVLIFLTYSYMKKRDIRKQLHRNREMLLKENLNIEKMKQEQKQEIDAMRNRLLALFVQELRTPLSLIMAPLKDLLKEKSQAQNLSLQVAYRNALRMVDACDQLKAIYGQGSLVAKLRVAPYPVEKMIDSNLFGVRELLKVYSIDFHCEKRIKKDMEFYVDKKKIEFIIHNLLTNAFTHTHYAGAVSFSVCETLENGIHYVSLIVEDDGNGRVKTAEQLLSGEKPDADLAATQLGFTIMKQMVEAHHGTISLESVEGKGTKVVVNLPADKAVIENDENILFTDPEELTNSGPELIVNPEPEIEPEPETTNEVPKQELPVTMEAALQKVDVPSTPTEGGKKTMLIVEDHKDIRLYLKVLFGSQYNLLMATNGQEGVDIAKKELPDLVICDVMMPVKDGFECCRELKEAPETCGIPFIMLTAKVEDEDIIHGLELGADDYVLKPFTPGILRAKVHNLINGRQTLKQMYTKLFKLPGEDAVVEVEETEKPEVEVKAEDPFINSVIKIVEENICEADFSVKKLAAEMNMSQPTLYRKVKQSTDYTIIELIRGVRMRRAGVLLKTKQYGVQEVAEMVGYNDIPTFRKHFVDAFGTTPSTYE
ncbi:response regulator [uncultured Bacteroides sp.]|uniref:response regulator n=1 Tax=uncultured Bacteroides sp. TaxID=162156 RepID=UPI0025E83870|nr:response regulator [uncultured Bacteroides sp.]